MTAFVHEERLAAQALAQASATEAEIIAGLDDAEQAAGWAILAGTHGLEAAVPALMALLDDDGLAARAAVWALGRLPAEATLCAGLTDGGLDLRENSYRALGGIIARDAASAGLADLLAERLVAENTRSKEGFTGLGEQVCRLLAMLGDARTADSIEAVMAADPYTDRFELDRLRKAIADGGRDQESISEALADWPKVFAEDLYEAASPEADAESVTEEQPTGEGLGEAPPPPQTDEFDDDDSVLDEDEEVVDADETDGPDDQAAEFVPLDWEAFQASPEAAALDERTAPLIAQLGPMLEQVVARMTGRMLSELQGQELAAVLLQVLPQAMPPQAVQAALSPEAINGYQALVKWMISTGAAQADLLEGIAIVREQLQESIRRSGMLGGPDYSDPDAVTDDS